MGGRRLATLLTKNGKSLPALVDSGADVSLISDSALKFLYPFRQLLLKPVTETITAINKTALNVMGSINLSFDNTKKPLNFIVVPDVNHQLIIGMDSMLKGDAELNVVRKTFKWFGRYYKLIDYIPHYTNVGASIKQTNTQIEIGEMLKNYESIFEERKYPGLINTEHMARIDTGNSPPIKCKMYRTPLKRQKAMRQQIDELLEYDIIEPSISPWAAPAMLVPKPGKDEFRLVGAYMKLNSVTVPDTYPIHPIQNIFDHMKNSKVYTKLDLRSSFYQVLIDPRDRDKTTFVCEYGAFRYTRMAMGLKNSSSIFCRVLESILKPYIAKFCFLYIDDILIYSENMEEHKKHLKIILDALKKANVQLKHSKCIFAAEEVELLGFIIGKNGIRPVAEKVRALEKAEPPRSKKQLQSFLGSANYYRKFLENYGMITVPLYDLLKKDVPFEWTDECQSAFDMVKSMLISDKVMLAYPDSNKKYKLFTDASGTGIAGVLKQTDNTGCDRVIQYYSQKLNKAQKNYSTTEREALAVVNSLKCFRTYVLGSEVEIYTDHRPLLPLFKKRIDCSRVER